MTSRVDRRTSGREPIRVVFLSGEPETPGHYYRVANVASALSSPNIETAILDVRDLRGQMPELDEVAVLWIWRAPYSRTLARAIEAARRRHAPVVFDIDDLLFRPELARSDVIDGTRRLGFAGRAAVRLQYRGLQRTLTEADYCTAPTEPLAREMRLFGKRASVVPNGFDESFLRTARAAVDRRGDRERENGVTRIGYVAGTPTHQRDLALAVPALVRVLEEHREIRFVCFEGAIDLAEFPELTKFADQLELRQLVPLPELPYEYARLDVSIAPLEVGNRFCEAKSELKFFEAALAGVATVASPTEPLAGAIRHGVTGYLAGDESSWYEYLTTLVTDRESRERVALAAYRDVLWAYGPERRALIAGRLVGELRAEPFA